MAFAIALTGTAMIVRGQRLGTVAMVLVLFGPAEAGYTAFAVHPVPVIGGIPLPLTIVLYGALGVLLVWTALSWRRGRPEARRAGRRGACSLCLLALLLFVAIDNGILLNLEPGYAVASMLINAAWFAFWLPPTLRTSRSLARARIESPPNVVFDHVVDTALWPLYRDDIEVLTLDPSGPLQTGSEFVARVPKPPGARTGPHPEVKFIVTLVDRPRSYVVVPADRRRDLFRMDLIPDGSGTRVEVRSIESASYPEAAFGRMLDIWRHARSRGQDSPRLAKLRHFLESSPGH